MFSSVLKPHRSPAGIANNPGQPPNPDPPPKDPVDKDAVAKD